MFTALMPLKSDFTSGWETVKKANLVPTKSETVGQKVNILSNLELVNLYSFCNFINIFLDSETSTRNI